jgi:uncharacterized Zn-binding protein involved in type VI secretion
MRRPIRLGDPTTHGGTVVHVAATHAEVLGRPLARLGDHCTCPRLGHGSCVIVEGDPDWTIDGVPVALEGHHTSCGAQLVATVGEMTRG